MKPEPVEVAIAILHRSGKFLMQLRDNTPGIVYPGHWGLFGGHLEPDETPEAALTRELLEEIGYEVRSPIKFGCYNDARVIRHVYHAPLTVGLDRLNLQEGWDLGLLTPDEIDRGSAYSAKAASVQPFGHPHQQILLDFIGKGKRQEAEGRREF
jgi:8-oxo-dGTP pyrophosphatase MutT (NUDIX family)